MKQVLLLSFIAWNLSLSALSLYAQTDSNCFLEDFMPKSAPIPPSVPADKTDDLPTVTVNLSADTLGAVSKYIFGNAWAAWAGNVTGEPVLVDNIKTLAPTLIRFPGGSWADIFFWNGNPADVPDSILDGFSGEKVKFYAISGKNDWPTTTDNYYRLREITGTQGLISINYGYARYGQGENPVVQAAHLAADWVRYDNGRTKFWEIGNENGGPWEAGWMIDTATNRDGQPRIITGKLYGQHFRIFADSMRAAAAETGATIYIGGQVLHFDGSGSWNEPDRTWNAGFLGVAGDAADFYVMHNYFGSAATVDNVLSIAASEPKKNIDFIRQDAARYNAAQKPVAITEYNMNSNDNNPTMTLSNINGIQAVILFNEFIKNNYGLAARWLLVTGESGMFYQGGNNSFLWQPRPEFYYAYFQQRFTGDHAIPATADNNNVLAYASRFASGETGVVLVNRGETDQVINLDPGNIGIGERYYWYTLAGGDDNGDFSLVVSVNGVDPSGTQWGPRDELEDIPAHAVTLEDDIVLDSPGHSVQFIMIDAGERILGIEHSNSATGLSARCYPNPFVSATTIEFLTGSAGPVSVVVFNHLGEKVLTLVDESLPPDMHSVVFDGTSLPAGIYFCRLRTGNRTVVCKMVLIH